MAAQQRLACPVYEGKAYNPAAAKAFLEEYDAYCLAYGLDDDAKLTTWSAALKDKAREWLLHHKQTAQEVTWETTYEAFKEHYTAPVPRANRATMTSDVKQKQGEDVRAFAVRCSNLAFDTLIPPDATEFPILERTYQADAAAGAAAPPPPVAINVTLNAADIKAITRIFAMERAIDIFVAGVNQNVKDHLVIDQSWDDWDEMLKAAKTIEQNVRPQAIKHQLQQHNGIGAVSNGQAFPAHPVQEILPVQQGQYPQQRPTGTRPKRRTPPTQPQATPDPQQHHTHRKPIKCNFCFGTYHTERHCLAKAKAQAKQPMAPIQQEQQPAFQQPQHAAYQQQQQPIVPMPGQVQQLALIQQQQPPQHQQPMQLMAAPQPAPVAMHGQVQPEQQQQQIVHSHPVYPPPGFYNGE